MPLETWTSKSLLGKGERNNSYSSEFFNTHIIIGEEGKILNTINNKKIFWAVLYLSLYFYLYYYSLAAMFPQCSQIMKGVCDSQQMVSISHKRTKSTFWLSITGINWILLIFHALYSIQQSLIIKIF